jgi:hypothetical protein
MRIADHPLLGPALQALAREFRAIALPDKRFRFHSFDMFGLPVVHRRGTNASRARQLPGRSIAP